MKKIVKQLLAGVVLIVVLPILTLNVEVVAQRLGWHEVLNGLLKEHSPGFWTFVRHPIVYAASLFSAGLAVGVWLDALLKTFNKSGISEGEGEKESLASDLADLANVIDITTGNLFSDTNRERMPSLVSETYILMRKLKQKGYSVPEIKNTSRQDVMLKVASEFFKAAAPLIREGFDKEVEVVAAQFSSSTLQERIANSL